MIMHLRVLFRAPRTGDMELTTKNFWEFKLLADADHEAGEADIHTETRQSRMCIVPDLRRAFGKLRPKEPG